LQAQCPRLIAPTLDDAALTILDDCLQWPFEAACAATRRCNTQIPID
jgi:hypothetical protein